MSTFFKHENHPYPPSLSDRGKLRLGKKSDLLIILTQKTQQEPPGTFDVKVLYGAAVVLPRNWPDFLRDPMNKQELFTFLSSKIASTAWPVGKQVFITSGVRVVGTDTSHFMLPCNHEEADTRIMIHLLDALEHGSYTCLVCTVDTDVVVILIGKFHALLTKSTALPVFHCCTGCDTTSAFCGKGKKSAWDAWNSYPEVTQAFNYMAANPHTPLETRGRDERKRREEEKRGRDARKRREEETRGRDERKRREEETRGSNERKR
ncbi:Protein U3 [Dissostichus eleginoides]|uniref:Protein U3 n=1 Tax=Dissostichus eleginoides TaxID=100907 RepID=A0AAD9BYZ1_DISEL|nr:Protein U3 [Dissostichus eleginoides]